MGYTIEPLISINVRLSSHNDERDLEDKRAAKRLYQEINDLIRLNPDYKRIASY